QALGASLPFGSYQILGNLNLHFFQSMSPMPRREYLTELPTSGGGQCEDTSGYSRVLDLSTALAQTQFVLDGVKHVRELLSSRRHQCVAYRIAAEKGGCISFNAQLSRPEKFRTEAVGDDGLLMQGQLENGKDGKGVKYACLARVKTKGGKVYTEDDILFVRNADEAVIYITMATDMKSFAGRNLDDARAAVFEDMEKAFVVEWKDLLEHNIADHQAYFNRVEFSLNQPASDKPLPERLLAHRMGSEDKGLAELFFNYGRYLLISSSELGGLPANMQGIWAEEIQAPWNCDWHLDAQQMNFWPAENCNLSEFHLQYMDLLNFLKDAGQTTAKCHFDARGWVAHTITNPWGFTAPGEGATWGAAAGCAAWVCQHIWDHYLFTCDDEFLKWAYPILKGAAEFYLDMLFTDPETGYLVTAPANSPENRFYAPDGYMAGMCAGPTFDMQVVRYLFNACINATAILGTDQDFAETVRDAMSRLVPTRISSDGRIMEWLKEYKEAAPYHRHVSHLWGAYPGDEITPQHTPELCEAVLKSIDKRGKYTSAGWANMHRVGILARLGKGDRAYELIEFHLKYCSFPNLFCKTVHLPENVPCPEMPAFDALDFPFQIDANLGGTGCIAEMLVQSHLTSGDFKNRVHNILLLPALPAAWPSGHVRGLKARGNIQVDIKWNDGLLESVRLVSFKARFADVTYNGKTIRVDFVGKDEIIMTAEDFR
ncbi:MAG TPA: glycoside hydrolase N-terminal domain-containing protein, partial [Clostridia bacterium]|nr:glycoside hydrolase N-terminal domain-containing protein [Clostridia bacterium]